jgi:hypothetical protein
VLERQPKSYLVAKARTWASTRGRPSQDFSWESQGSSEPLRAPSFGSCIPTEMSSSQEELQGLSDAASWSLLPMD